MKFMPSDALLAGASILPAETRLCCISPSCSDPIGAMYVGLFGLGHGKPSFQDMRERLVREWPELLEVVACPVGGIGLSTITNCHHMHFAHNWNKYRVADWLRRRSL